MVPLRGINFSVKRRMRPANPVSAGWIRWMPSFSVLPGVKVFLFSLRSRAGLSTKNLFRMARNLLKDQHMLNARSLALALAGGFFSLNLYAQFADSAVSYSPGSGVISGYNNPNSALGAPTTFIGYQNADPFNPPYRASDIVGIGTGGWLTLHLSTPILNSPSNPYGLDFIIFGHSGFNITNGNYSGGGITDGSFFTGGTSTSHISVSADGVNFYTLDPSHAPQVDGLFPTDSGGNPLLPVNPALHQSDFAGQGLAGIRNLYAGSAGGMGFDLSMAEDSSGHSISLPVANYVRIDVLNDAAYMDAISAVPEPGVCSLLLLAAAICALRRGHWQTRKAGGTFPSKI